MYLKLIIVLLVLFISIMGYSLLYFGVGGSYVGEQPGVHFYLYDDIKDVVVDVGSCLIWRRGEGYKNFLSGLRADFYMRNPLAYFFKSLKKKTKWFIGAIGINYKYLAKTKEEYSSIYNYDMNEISFLDMSLKLGYEGYFMKKKALHIYPTLEYKYLYVNKRHHNYAGIDIRANYNVWQLIIGLRSDIYYGFYSVEGFDNVERLYYNISLDIGWNIKNSGAVFFINNGFYNDMLYRDGFVYALVAGVRGYFR